MQLGMIGLGRMGANMARRLMRGGHECVVFDLSADNVRQLAGEDATEKTVADLSARLESADVIIDGGNSYFKDDVRRAKALQEKEINYVDVGTSGGVWGLQRGYCM